MHQFNLFPEIFVRDRQALCSSLDVAAHFGKRHKNVLTVIRRHMNDCSPAFRGLNFAPTFYPVPGPKGAARLLRVSRHVVYRLRRRFGFLTEAAA